MNDLKEGHGFTIPEATHEALRRDYRSARVSGPEVEATIRSVHEAAGTLLDPHSAIGLAAARRLREEGLKGDIVTLATAHPAKFPEAVKKASGQTPELPEEIAAKIGGDEHYTVVPADQDAVREQLLQ
jgi:threonine synthase